MGVCDDSSQLCVWRLNSRKTTDPRPSPEHMVTHVLPDPYNCIFSNVCGHRHLVGTTLYEQSKAPHGAQTLHDGLQRLPGRLQCLDFLGGNTFDI